ncbi:MAG: O-methyltransferase [Peptoniphilaceae bacterium]|nr:O-methyltransferase [Peptoniphilaceae bacterium]MDY6019607.1 O-methyltransferase [Anaerococcus sp.]
MTNINCEHTEQFLNDIYLDRDYLEIKKYANENKIPIMKLETKEFLKSLLLIKKPKNILEIGSAVGYSSLIFSKYSNSRITTIEKSEKMYKIALNNFKKYHKNIEIINEDAIKALDNIDQGFDFVFIDANKAHYRDYFDICKDKLLNKDGIIVCDNVLFRGQISNDDLYERRQTTIIKRLRKFLTYITNLQSYQTSIIPIGDGISITSEIRS